MTPLDPSSASLSNGFTTSPTDVSAVGSSNFEEASRAGEAEGGDRGGETRPRLGDGGREEEGSEVKREKALRKERRLESAWALMVVWE